MSEIQSEFLIPPWDVADRMGKALRTSGVSPRQMAVILDCHRNTVGNYLHARVRVPRSVLIVWADVTHFPLEWLETGQVSASLLPSTPDTPADFERPLKVPSHVAPPPDVVPTEWVENSAVPLEGQAVA